MERKISPTYPIEIKNEPCPETSVQAKPEEASNFPPFQSTIVKEELILDDDEPPNPEHDPEPSLQQSTVIVTSGFEITLMQDEPVPDQTDQLLVAVKEEEQKPSKRNTDTTALLRCGKCKKHFTKAKSYQTHCHRHRNIEARRFLCKPCRKPFGSKPDLARHERMIHGLTLKRGEAANDRLCNMCGKLCDTPDMLREHLQAHSNLKKKLFQCENCGKCFCTARNLRNHVTYKVCENMPTALPQEDDIFKCSTCGKIFSQRYLIDIHMRRHLARRYLRAETLDLTERKVSDAGTKPLVVEMDDGVKQFKCPVCLKVFSQRDSCARHIYRHMAIAKWTFQCGTCGLYLGNNKELVRHEFQKHGKTIKTEPTEDTVEIDDRGRFKCSDCTKTFIQRHLALRHMRRHRALDEGTYQCKVCGKLFGVNAELKKHALEKHNETQMVRKVDPLEKDANGNFKCTKCPQTFPTRSQCFTHIRRHRILDSATYQCKKCKKCFVRPKELEKHEQANTREAKNQCMKYQKLLKLDISKMPEKSGKEKSDKEKTDKEYTIREENGTFICSSCNMIFLQRRSCVAHIRRHVDIDKGRFKCGTCGMHYGTNKELRRHEVQKHGATTVKSMRPGPVTVEQDESGCFTCPDCPQTFLLKQTCIKHMRRHEILKSGKFRCQLEGCDLIFGSNFELKRHSSLHKTDRSVEASSSKSIK